MSISSSPTSSSPTNSIEWRKVFGVYSLCLSSFFFGPSRFSYVGFMVLEFFPFLSSSEVGYYAGLLNGAFFLGQTINGVPLGIIADRHGVIAPMFISALAGVVFPLLFAFSPNFWFACLVCVVYGVLNGTLPLVKVRLYDILPPEKSTYTLSYIGTIWGFCSVMGPSLGGYLSYPATKYASLDCALFRSYPFLLPNVLCSFLSLMCVGILAWEHYVLKIDAGHKTKASEEELTFLQYMRTNNTQVVLVLSTYAALGGIHMLTSEMFPLYLMLPQRQGGFGLSTNGIGTMGLIQGIIVIIMSYVAPRVNNKIGFRESIMYSSFISIPFMIAFPFSSNIDGWTGYTGLIVASLLQGTGRIICGAVGFNAVIVMTNYCTQRTYLTRVNGVGNSLTSLMRCFVPSVVCALFAYTATEGGPYPFNRHFVYWVYAVAALGVGEMARRLRPERNHDRARVSTLTPPPKSLAAQDGEDGEREMD